MGWADLRASRFGEIDAGDSIRDHLGDRFVSEGGVELDDKHRQALLDGLLKRQADLTGLIAGLQGG